jgi:hypothetical protein
MVIEGLFKQIHFIEKNKNQKYKELEGDIFLHFNFSIKQDQKLIKEVIKIIKEDPQKINTFTISLLLIISKIPGYDMKILKFLKNELTFEYEDSLKEFLFDYTNGFFIIN